jgi:tripartite-type tricarboxylate transporter receptor subunit TctC
MMRLLGTTIALFSLLLAAATATAQQFPNKPIHLVVPLAPGGGVDVQARILAKGMEERLKVPVVVENRPGAGGIIGAEYVSKAPADGYVLGVFVASSLSANFLKNPTFDIQRSFDPVASISSQYLVLGVNSQVPANNVAEMVSYLKANPGKLNYGIAASVNQIAMALFQEITGTNVVGIEYRGGAPLIAAFLANEFSVYLASPGIAYPHIQSGKFRLFAVTGNQRMSALPDLPTVTEIGMPKLTLKNSVIVMAPAGVSQAVIDRLSPVIREVVRSPEMDPAVRMNGVLLDLPPPEVRKFLATEVAEWAEAARVAKYEPQ